MKCWILKDLLSNYINGLCSRETNAEIKKHLDDCGECRAAYEAMMGDSPTEKPQEGRGIDSVKAIKTKLLKKKIMAAASISIIVLAGLFIFAKNYYIPIPFDSDHMWVNVYKAAKITNSHNSVSLENIEYFTDMVSEENKNVIDEVELVYKGINDISKDMVVREINRNGKQVKVYYYCYKETLWDSLFSDPDLLRGGHFSKIHRNHFDLADFEPQMREIYYLPAKNLYEYENLTDGEFDCLREKATLIWSGVS